jgi:hypothetical protein
MSGHPESDPAVVMSFVQHRLLCHWSCSIYMSAMSYPRDKSGQDERRILSNEDEGDNRGRI